MRLRFVSGTLLLIGVLGGTLGSSFKVAEPAERGGFKVVEADLHVHSHAGDGLLSPFGLVFLAQSKGLQAIAITDHNRIYGAQASSSFSGLIDGPTVIVGEEITAPDYHLIGLGLSDPVEWRQSLAEATRKIHNQGGVAIAAHPGKKYEQTFGPAIRDLDGSEVMHVLAHASSERATEMREFYEHGRAGKDSFAAVGSSDHHWFNTLGLCRTYVFVRSNGPEEILEAVRSGRTVVYDLQGNMFGDPELIRLLQEQPIKHNALDYSYRGSGLLDVVTRTCGWLGLTGLVFLGSRRRRP